MSATAALPATRCAHCGTPLHGPYCHRCGEKRLDHHDYALGHFLEHAVDTTTHFDFKVLKGAWSLIARPGRMTADVLRGCRVPWPKPLQLFLVVNVLFVFAAHRLGLRIFNTPFRYHRNNWYGPWADQQLSTLAAHRHETVARVTEHFDHLADVLSKSLVFVFIPLLALVLGVLFWRKRRYYLEHIVTATHYLTMLLLLQLLATGPLTLLLYLSRHWFARPLTFSQADVSAGVLMLLLLTGWGYWLLYRTYGGSRGPALTRAAVLSVAFAWLLMSVYRPFLFLVTYLLL